MARLACKLRLFNNFLIVTLFTEERDPPGVLYITLIASWPLSTRWESMLLFLLFIIFIKQSLIKLTCIHLVNDLRKNLISTVIRLVWYVIWIFGILWRRVIVDHNHIRIKWLILTTIIWIFHDLVVHYHTLLTHRLVHLYLLECLRPHTHE